MAAGLVTFTDAERDRRWAGTRQRMAAAGIQALVMPSAGGHWDQFFANQRYLSQVGGNQYRVAMVFPVAGDPTVVIPGAGEAVRWRALSWVEDIRGSDGGRFGAVLVDRLKELGLSDATLGVPHLDGGARVGESPIPAGTLEVLHRELPRARLVDATRLMDGQRATKSDEEIAIMERASAVAEAGIFALGYHVRVGMLQTEALSILQGAILKAGGEVSNQILWECSQQPGRTGWHTPAVPIERGDIIQNELEAKVAGYSAREVHPICVGKPPQQVYQMFELSTKIFDEAMPLLTPGAPLQAVTRLVEAATEGTPFRTSLTSYGRGLAEEVLDDTSHPAFHDRQVLMFKPVVRSADGMGINFCATVVVTPDGGRRLGKRPMELMLTSRSFMSTYARLDRPEPTAPWLTPLP